MVNTPHKHTHKGFTCSKQFRLLGHRLQFQLLPFLLFWIFRRRHFCFYTPWCLLTNVTVKSSLLMSFIGRHVSINWPDTSTSRSSDRWSYPESTSKMATKTNGYPNMLFLKKDNSWSMMHMVAWALHDVFRQAFYCFIVKKDNKQGNY